MHLEQLSRRDCMTLLGASLSSVMCSRSAHPQGTFKALPSGDYGPWGFDLAGADFDAKPGDDFFRYANGAWFDRAVIAPDRDINSVDTLLSDITESRIRDILMRGEIGVEPSAREDAVKINTFYTNFMDEARLEALDADPLAPFIKVLREAETRSDLAELMTSTFFGSILSLSIGIDAKAPDKYAVVIGQAGLGLPDRDYYLVAHFSSERTAYSAYIAQVLSLIGWEMPEKCAAAILAFETAIAKASWTLTEQQNPEKTYNPMAIAHLAQVAPFPWRRFLRGADLASVGRVVLAEFTAVQRIVALYAITPMATLKAWQAFHLVNATAPYLSRRLATPHFRFHENILAGVARPAERWKRGVSLVDSEMGDAIGRLYVARYFSSQTKAQIDDMVTQIRLALRERLECVGWMSHKTKEKAINKLSYLTVKSGYPKVWRDYSGLEIKAGELLGNVQIARTFDWARRVARLDSQVDRNEWDTTPQTINSNYSSNLNEVVLPAGQMQAPYFHAAADRAVNYGGIGTIIGHELIHALDDDGRKYNAEGALSNWWTDADAREFNVRTANLSRQYGSFEPLRGMHVNGRLTINESIADLGGVLVALDAYHRSLAGRSAAVVDGLTGDQRFFLSYAQSFRAKTTDKSTRLQLASDPHAPERYRVNATLRNIGPWYQSFNVRESDKLFLPAHRRVQIW